MTSSSSTRPADQLEVDVCIVGSGPAAQTLALELAGTNRSIALIESGAAHHAPALQDLNVGQVRGTAYAGLVRTRRRQVGGTANLWNTGLHTAGIGAKYVPLGDVDCRTDGDEFSRWPFARADLDVYYARAQHVCGLGPPRYDFAPWNTADRPVLDLDGTPLESRVFQLGPALPFAETYPRSLRASTNVSLRTEMTAIAVRHDRPARRVDAIECAAVTGERLTVRAGIYVLAAGAIENARLLLAAAPNPKDAPGNGYGLLGACFMEHPRDRSLELRPRVPDIAGRLAFYDRHRAADGTTIAGHLGFEGRWLAREELPNALLTFVPAPRLRLPWRLHAGLARVGWPLEPTGFGWTSSDGQHPSRRLEAMLHLEQRPRPDNRVGLGSARDGFGVRRAVLHWSWTPEEQAGLDRLRGFVAEWLQGTGLFDVRVVPRRLDPNAHHHAGTTRMHRDPRFGVTDPDGKVHDLDNLFVTGASVFPTAGVANPTLTIVALALRLADHLKTS